MEAEEKKGLCETNYDFNVPSETDMLVQNVSEASCWPQKLGLWISDSMYVAFLSLDLLQPEKNLLKGKSVRH